MPVNKLVPAQSIFFLCDVQTKFRPAIYGYEHVVATCNKMVKLAKLLGIPLVCTTQNAKALGPIDPAIELDTLGDLRLGTIDKTLFSMVTPDIEAILDAQPNRTSIVVFGIESHVCVLQTALSLLATKKYTTHIVADGVSSCNSFEIPIALDRLRIEGAVIGSSESIAFQLMGDAGSPLFKQFSMFIKDVKESTKAAGESLLQGKTPYNPPSDGEAAAGGVVVKSAM